MAVQLDGAEVAVVARTLRLEGRADTSAFVFRGRDGWMSVDERKVAASHVLERVRVVLAS